jgi:hypothetical protein
VTTEGQAALRSADGQRVVLDGLPQQFQQVLGKLGHLVQEQHAAVCRADTSPPQVWVSPRRRHVTPPTSPACEIVWCGARNGRLRISGVPEGSMSATE